MKTTHYLMMTCFIFCLAVPAGALAGKGYMGGQGNVVAEEEPPDDTGGVPVTVEGPLNDKMSDSGKLFGDLFKILRQQGISGDKKLVPEVNAAGEAVLTDGVQLFVEDTNIVGGEPVLTVIDPESTNELADYGWYAAEIGVNPDETPIYGVAQSPYPALCVQPVADWARWGDINITGKTGLTKNRIPMVITYDYTWGRSECEIGQLDGEVTVDAATGELTIPVNEWFIAPGETWTDDNNGTVTYADGVRWTDLVQEVHFGRLNLSRSPEAVMQAAFDEAINTINSPDTISIGLDAAGRLLLEKIVYDELLVDGDGNPLPLEEHIFKAIDSPLENLALYVKLIRDGHLVTPADERMPIDRSMHGGIPIWKMLELTDGPADAALRPTIDISKMESESLGSLVDAADPQPYTTYYQCINDSLQEVPCLIMDSDPVQPEYEEKLVGNPAAIARQLVVVTACSGAGTDADPYICTCPEKYDDYNPYTCETPSFGIISLCPEAYDPENPLSCAEAYSDGSAPNSTDLGFAASFLAAAADKTGHIGVDMVVYLNSILGINQVLGYSEYDSDGVPTEDAIDYGKNPVYFNYDSVSGYSRSDTIGGRGSATVLQGGSGTWTETAVPLMSAHIDGVTVYDDIGQDMGSGFPNNSEASDNIFGFTQEADDDLGVIKFIHTYQIPGSR